VVKQNHRGEEMLRYGGELRTHIGGEIVIEARFAMQRPTIHGIAMKMGDLFIESYYADRWYNIYEARDVDTDAIKFWYCNVSYPAELKGELLYFRDLALDLFVYPDGRQEVLDEDEFAALDLSPEDRAGALEGLRQLQVHFERRFAK
jgi:predicted RNA-binding protein associated with RNAse of E/G family